MKESSHHILVVDDTRSNLAILRSILQNEGYSVQTSESGEMALECIREHVPDLVLLDMILPGIDGLEVCKCLQNDSELCEIPVIFITAVAQTDKITEAFSKGAVDYVVKPFNRAEVVARVKTHLRVADTQRELKRLNALALDANPLTRLPGNNSINRKLQEIIDEQLDAVVIYADLDNFKPYNDVYGYVKGDEVLMLLADILIRYVYHGKDDCRHFVGHIGGDDFVLVLPLSDVARVTDNIKYSFDNAVTDMYSAEDLEAGGIRTIDRQGNPGFFPFLSLSMGGVHIVAGKYNHVPQIAADCAEVKKMAKQLAGSGLYMDRRNTGDS